MIEVVNKVKIKLPISSVIGKKVALKRSAGRLVGLCPFHSEKTPSFIVDDAKCNYHCYGCGAHGDIVSFVQEYENCTFVEAVKILAGEAGVQIPSYDAHSNNAKTDVIRAIYQEAAIFYEHALYTRDGLPAIEYLQSRGISQNDIARYKFGYAPRHTELYNHLKSKFSQTDLECAQLFRSGSNNLYDPLYGRLIIPIINTSGQIIAFGGRKLNDNNDAPKYINSAENPLFHKSSVLYNMNNATKPSKKLGYMIIVEGYFDAISLAQDKIENAVATMGTSLKVEHITNLWKVIDAVVLCLDSDLAGSKAAQKIATHILPHMQSGKVLKFCLLQNAKDPDEYVKRYGREAFLEQIKSAKGLSEFIAISVIGNKNYYSPPDEKAVCRAQLTQLAKEISDISIKTEYSRYWNDSIYKLLNRNPAFNKKQNDNADVYIATNYKLQIFDEKHIIDLLLAILQYPKELLSEEVFIFLLNIKCNTSWLDNIISEVIKLNSICCPALSNAEIEKIRASIAIFYKHNNPTYDTFLEAKKAVLAGILKYNLAEVKNQIKDAADTLIQDADVRSMERLHTLKKYETVLQKEFAALYSLYDN